MEGLFRSDGIYYRGYLSHSVRLGSITFEQFCLLNSNTLYSDSFMAYALTSN